MPPSNPSSQITREICWPLHDKTPRAWHLNISVCGENCCTGWPWALQTTGRVWGLSGHRLVSYGLEHFQSVTIRAWVWQVLACISRKQICKSVYGHKCNDGLHFLCISFVEILKFWPNILLTNFRVFRVTPSTPAVTHLQKSQASLFIYLSARENHKTFFKKNPFLDTPKLDSSM